MKKKYLHLEIIRILAILCVMFIHTGGLGHEAFSYTESHITFTLSLILSAISEVGVDLFWMVSGALLLGKKESAKTVYTKRLPRMIIVLFIFSFIRYFYNYFMGLSDEIGVFDFVRRFLSGSIFVPFWFLYFYIGIILMLPFMRRAVQAVTPIEWNYFVVLELFFLIIVRIIELIPHTIVAVPFFIPESINCFILGYFAEQVVQEEYLKRKEIPAIFGGLCVIMVVVEYFLSVMIGDTSADTTNVYTTFLVQPLAFCLVIFIRSLSLRAKECTKIVERVILYLGACSFGLYLIEDYTRNALYHVVDTLTPVITELPACIVWILCSYIVGVIIVGILKKIPMLSKLI